MSTLSTSYGWRSRETSFFCVGMLVIPLFWAWWTFLPRFRSWHRVLAFTWLAIYLALAALFPDWIAAVIRGAIAQVECFCYAGGLVLWVWLAARLSDWGYAIIGLVVSIDSLSILGSLAMASVVKLGFGWFPAFYFALPGLLHLILDDHRAREKQTRMRTQSP